MPRAEIAHNVVSGVIVGVIAFPLSIALAVAVGVPPIAGLYTAVFAGGVASAFGGSRFNITGPTAALIPLLLRLVIEYGIEALATVGLMAGVLLLIMGILKFGRLVRYMPQLVIVGFTAGIAISIAVGQVNNLLGLSGTNPSLPHFHERLGDTLRHLGTVEPASAAIGLISVGFLFAYQSRSRRVPGALLAVIVATLAVRLLGLEAETVASKYGDLPRSLPTPSLAFFQPGLIVTLLPSAAAVAVLAAVESLLSAVVADGMAADGRRHNPDRELIGQGLANLVAPMMGGIPATAAIARTAAGIRDGATSRFSGVVHSLTVLLLTVVLAGVAGDIPLAALAAILIVVAYSIADVPQLTRLVRTSPREDLIALTTTVTITVFLDLSYAIGAGIITSAVILLRRLNRVPVVAEILGTVTDPDNGDHEHPAFSPALTALVRSHPEVLFFNAQGVISFHSAATFEALIPRSDPRPLLLRMRDIHHVDTSGLVTLSGVIEHRQRAGGRTLLTDVRPEVEAALRRFGIADLVGPGGLGSTTEEALDSLIDAEKPAPNTTDHRPS